MVCTLPMVLYFLPCHAHAHTRLQALQSCTLQRLSTIQEKKKTLHTKMFFVFISAFIVLFGFSGSFHLSFSHFSSINCNCIDCHSSRRCKSTQQYPFSHSVVVLCNWTCSLFNILFWLHYQHKPTKYCTKRSKLSRKVLNAVV